MLNSLFYNYHGSEKELKLKKRKPRLGTSRYMGVHKDLSKTPEPLKYEVRFNTFRLGSYALETDAALAYDSAIRARALEEHYNKINFNTQEDYSRARKTELNNRGIIVDLEETLSHMSSYVSKVAEVAEGERGNEQVPSIESEMLNNLFYNIHGSQEQMVLKKKSVKSSKSLSCYNGVGKKKKESDASTQFFNYRLGRYTLQSDAALAYDSAIRARGLKKHYEKINFGTKEDYLQAREKEMKEQSVEVDLGETLVHLTSYVSKVPVVAKKSDMLSNLFYNYHGSEKELVLKKNKSEKASSIYNGVSLSRGVFTARFWTVGFTHFRLGKYCLETDAALAHDSAIRVRAFEDKYEKLNFTTEKSYLEARKKEMEAKGINVDLSETLSYITGKLRM